MENLDLYCDNQSALDLSNNPMHHEKTKHIDVKLNFIRDILEKFKFFILKNDIKVNPTDMLTKSLPTEKFKFLLDLVNVRRY